MMKKVIILILIEGNIGEEGLLELISTTLRLSHTIPKGVSNQKNALNWYKPLKGFLRSSSIMLKRPLRLLL